MARLQSTGSVNICDTGLANGGKRSGIGCTSQLMIAGFYHCPECDELQIEGKDTRIHMPSMIRVCSYKLLPGKVIEVYSTVTEAVAHGLQLIGKSGL